MTADRGDIYRYLGCRDSQPPAELRQMVEDCLAALEKAVAPRRVYRLYPLDEAVEGTVRFGGLSLDSRDLAALLEGCGMVALLGVTLGPQADTLIRRSEKLEMSRAVVLDACASALAEAQAEDCQREAEAASGLRAVGRFSPGYGDLPLEEQGRLLALLDATRRIGLTLTGGGMLVPVKSIVALAGLRTGEPAGVSRICGGKCASCGKSDCPYRAVLGS